MAIYSGEEKEGEDGSGFYYLNEEGELVKHENESSEKCKEIIRELLEHGRRLENDNK